ncbi:MAG: MBL fold metallo-hydrolase [Ruminococcaceae bacterium]|nr:MBL fold metallo-hydrolase [Oscillospiraceae bacterium]
MFLSIVSGSSGNCTLVSHKNTTILVDCGLSCKKMEQALSCLGVDPCGIDGILVTHEHSDHTKGIGVASRKYSIPVYATLKTHQQMEIGNLHEKNIKYISPDLDFEIGDIGITPFSIPHDAANPVAYNIFYNNIKVSVATDIGKMNDYIMSHLKGSLAVLLESNHDIDMLKNGKYPMILKKRILSDYGHLSNNSAAETALELAKTGTKHLMLGHLSNENNTPRSAFYATAKMLTENGVDLKSDLALTVASRYEVTKFR